MTTHIWRNFLFFFGRNFLKNYLLSNFEEGWKSTEEKKCTSFDLCKLASSSALILVLQTESSSSNSAARQNKKKRVSNADFALLCLLYQDILYLMHTMIFKLPAKSKCLKQFQKQNRGHLTLIQNNPLVTLHELSQLHCTESSQGSPDSRTFIKFTMLYKNVERSAIFLGVNFVFFYDFKHFDFSGNLNIIVCIRYMIAW